MDNVIGKICGIILIVCLSVCTEATAKQEASLNTDSLINLLSGSKEDTNKVNLLNTIAGEFYTKLPDTVIAFASQAYELADKLQFEKGIIISSNTLGVHYWLKSNFSSALEYLQISLRHSEETGDKLSSSKALNNIGMLHAALGNFDKALDFFRKSLDLSRQIDNKAFIARNLLNLGGVYKETGDYETSVRYYKELNEVAEELNQKETYLLASLNIATVYNLIGHFGESYGYLQKAEDINSKLLNPVYEAGILAEQGKLRLKYAESISAGGSKIAFLPTTPKENFEQAIDFLKQSNRLMGSYGSLNAQQVCYQSLYEAYKGLGNIPEALSNLEESMKLKDSLNAEGNKKKMVLLENQREIELRDRQLHMRELEVASQQRIIFVVIALVLVIAVAFLLVYKAARKNLKLNRELESKNNDIASAYAKLNESNVSKDKFFSIISHDLRTPFAGLIGLTELLVNDTEKMTKDDIKRLSGQVFKASNSAFELLNDLLDWSRSQLGNLPFEPEIVNLSDLTDKVIQSMINSAEAKEIAVESAVDPNVSIMCDSNMVRTIVRNLLSNAVKFTDKNGRIVISVESFADRTKIIVSDNGVGMTPEQLHGIFRIDSQNSTRGTNNEKGTGLGLILCKEFAEKHGGNMSVESAKGKGSKFTCTIPVELPS